MKKQNPSGFGAYLFFKSWFLKNYYYEMSRPVTHRNLAPVIIADNGHTYYEYPEGMALPIERSAREQEYLQWMGAGLDAKNVKKLSDAAQFHIMESLKLTGKPNAFAKEIAKASAILTEIGERQERVVPLDLIINVLCTHLVRDDEDPAGWNPSIHKEKCDYFMDHHTDYQFFFRFSAFRKLSRMLGVSSENWQDYLIRARTEVKAVEVMIRSFLSEEQSSKNATIS